MAPSAGSADGAGSCEAGAVDRRSRAARSSELRRRVGRRSRPDAPARPRPRRVRADAPAPRARAASTRASEATAAATSPSCSDELGDALRTGVGELLLERLPQRLAQRLGRSRRPREPLGEARVRDSRRSRTLDISNRGREPCDRRIYRRILAPMPHWRSGRAPAMHPQAHAHGDSLQQRRRSRRSPTSRTTPPKTRAPAPCARCRPPTSTCARTPSRRSGPRRTSSASRAPTGASSRGSRSA